ncbi:conserved unknown protein [Ectocarpus siliculosus]|uniref:UDENN domain-containing protein n=1 Tax=Ectocarpus siliculosus TaxID=2880 RepID=D7FSS9_ECTSI|nr:conserved unknown protein [Ectocarpus siliculosus]|eukprot:CBJ31220.1 conserved unknown protein [Ectocarpus siliculosus]
MVTPRGNPRPKAYLSIGEYLRKAGAFKTVNVYYNEIISTHPSVALSEDGDTEDVDELAQGMIEAAQHGHLETLRFLAGKAQTGGEEGGVGTCIGERVGCLMLHLAAEAGHDTIVHYLVEDLWVDVDEATVRGMTALHYAAKANRTAVVRELSRLGADLEAKNDAGQVPAQLTKDRLLRRLFQQYLGGGGWGGAGSGAGGAMVDRFVSPSASRVVDYVAVMTVKLAPQLRAECDELSDLKQATVAQVCRFPEEDHEDTPMTDASNLAEICTQSCGAQGGPLAAYGTLLTDTSGARSYVWSKVLGVYQDAAQKGRARVHTALGPPPGDRDGAVPAGETSARVVLVLARHPYTAAFASICEHIAELILSEALNWGSLCEWPLDMEQERNQEIRFCMEHYASDLPLPLPSAQAEHTVLDRVLRYGDAHASHSSFPHLEEADLRCLTSRLGPDTILVALSCLLQEQSVLLLSDHLEDLAPATSALLGLLFPLRWPHTLIPVLPASLVHYLEAPVPFLMGMHQKGLDRVGADLSCITIINLGKKKKRGGAQSGQPLRVNRCVQKKRRRKLSGKEPQKRPSRRDSGQRSLAELPRALKSRAENRMRRCVPLEVSPVTDRSHHQPRASTLYTPGLRVAVVDVMVDLFGDYQTYRYVPGSQKRMIGEAPEDHRKLLEAVYSTQLWRIFSDDLLAEEAGANGENWEEQAQLFCACVERARHQGGVSGPSGDSHSCQDVLYPSEDVEEQLSLLSVYPEPTDNANGSAEGPQHAGDGMADSAIATASGKDQTGSADCRDEPPKEAPAPAVGGLQGKTDEVLKSITDSFATVTDMLGGVPPGGVSSKTSNPDGGSGAVDGGSGGASSAGGGQGGEAAAVKPDGGGWEMFKPPSMAEMKRRLEDMTAGGMPLSPPKVPLQKRSSPGQQSPARTGLSIRGKSREGRSASPTRRDPGAAAAAGLAKFGDGWRDFRRRSAEAVEEAVTKIKTVLDDSDEEGATDERVAARIAEKRRAQTAAASGGGGGGNNPGDDDAFWKPFGGGEDGDGEPVPLPTAEEVRRETAVTGSRSASTARRDLDAYYGGGSGEGGGS